MEIRITTLNENTTGRMGLLAEWGLSILVEVDGLKILLDTGANISVVHNAPLLGIDLLTIDRIVLSHGHYDHTGGLRQILLSRIGEKVEVIAHPDIWASKFWVSPYTRRLEEGSYNYVGMLHQRGELEDLGASFNLTKDPIWITENIVTTGEIPMVTEYEEIDPDLYVREGGEFHPDPLWDDRALVVKTDLGLIIVFGCGHRGLINTIYYAQKLTGVKTIHTVVGGLHLCTASKEQLEFDISKLREFGIKKLGASHCTGMPAAMRLAQEFGDAFFFNNAGTRVTIP
jgi:7,8-dihydropterin-6-yl-methyl-4-(beta-D-ribofuranosyl)aminobenzene 5'-phosphate synthase